MNRKLLMLGVLLVAQLLLSLGLAQRGNPLAPRHVQRPLADNLDRADRLEIDDGDGHQVTLSKAKDGWRLPDYFGVPADQGKVRSALDALAKARLNEPVATSGDAAERFQVADKKHGRHLVVKQGGRKLLDLYLGRSAGVGKSYLRRADEREVYLAKVAEWDFPAKASQWLDQKLLKKETSNLIAITIDGLRLIKKGQGDKAVWKAENPPKGQALDQDGVKRLLDALSVARVDEVLGTEVDKAWRLDKPERTLVLESKGHKVTWRISRPDKADYRVLKSSAHPWYFKLEGWNANPLLDATKPSGLFKEENKAEPNKKEKK